MTVAAADGRNWLWISYAYGLLVAAVIGYFLMRIPIQVTDSFTNMLALDRPFLDLMRDQFQQQAYLRPGLWAELKIVYDMSGGNYFYWYRLTQVAQVLVLILLFVRLLQPRSAAAATVVPLALAVLVGGHTFAWTVREAFPINTFLTILLCCAAAANIAFAQHRWWNDVLASALFVVSALTVESGLLVWVIFAGGYLVGLRGISRPGLIALCALLAIYFGLRFVVLDVGVPGLTEREAGFGFERYSAAALAERFGENPLGFYVYNIVASLLSVLVAEPRDGVWRLVRSFVNGRLEIPFVIGIVSSVLATALIVRIAWIRRRGWMSGRFSRSDQLVLLFAMVLAANAVISYAYTKDVIISPAGVFYAAAVFVGARDLVERVSREQRRVAGVAVLMLALSTLWAVRAVGLHAALAHDAYKMREQWAYVDDWMARIDLELLPRQAALKQQLQDDAVLRHPTPSIVREDLTRVFEVD